jgi:hypothetical protein
MLPLIHHHYYCDKRLLFNFPRHLRREHHSWSRTGTFCIFRLTCLSLHLLRPAARVDRRQLIRRSPRIQQAHPRKQQAPSLELSGLCGTRTLSSCPNKPKTWAFRISRGDCSIEASHSASTRPTSSVQFRSSEYAFHSIYHNTRLNTSIAKSTRSCCVRSFLSSQNTYHASFVSSHGREDAGGAASMGAKDETRD